MATSATTDLRNRVRGRVVGRSDPEYHAARGVVDGNFDPRPAAIVRVADAADVATGISIAGAEGKPWRSGGGHSGAGHGSVDDGSRSMSAACAVSRSTLRAGRRGLAAA